MDELTKRLWHAYTMKLYSTPEKNEIVTLAEIRSQVDIIVLRKINQSKKMPHVSLIDVS